MAFIDNKVHFSVVGKEDNKLFLVCHSNVGFPRIVFIEDISSGKRIIINKSYENQSEYNNGIESILNNWNESTDPENP